MKVTDEKKVKEVLDFGKHLFALVFGFMFFFIAQSPLFTIACNPDGTFNGNLLNIPVK